MSASQSSSSWPAVSTVGSCRAISSVGSADDTTGTITSGAEGVGSGSIEVVSGVEMDAGAAAASGCDSIFASRASHSSSSRVLGGRASMGTGGGAGRSRGIRPGSSSPISGAGGSGPIWDQDSPATSPTGSSGRRSHCLKRRAKA